MLKSENWAELCVLYDWPTLLEPTTEVDISLLSRCLWFVWACLCYVLCPFAYLTLWVMLPRDEIFLSADRLCWTKGDVFRDMWEWFAPKILQSFVCIKVTLGQLGCYLTFFSSKVPRELCNVLLSPYVKHTNQCNIAAIRVPLNWFGKFANANCRIV